MHIYISKEYTEVNKINSENLAYCHYTIIILTVVITLKYI